ncbi:TerD family protein [Streptomyces coerulescens]|uniref:TerD family protein n=1 Tax=Streptomyces coerulescens TaxID=29304 RepID=A0ABW0CZE2_STRCD
MLHVPEENGPGAKASWVPDQHTRWHADITQPRETVTIAVELYRHTNGWKARGVGQGYDTGLAGLATDYGINVEA